MTGKRTQPFVAPVRYNVPLLLSDAALLGWSDAELARQAKVSATAIFRLRRGADRPSTIAKLAEALAHPLSRYIVSEAAS